MPSAQALTRRVPSVVALIAALAVLLTSSNLRSPVSAFPPIADQVAGSLGASGLFIGLVGMALNRLAAALEARVLHWRGPGH